MIRRDAPGSACICFGQSTETCCLNWAGCEYSSESHGWLSTNMMFRVDVSHRDLVDGATGWEGQIKVRSRPEGARAALIDIAGANLTVSLDN
jgi:hypothetical protein